jgi:proton translocating ATP synthase F1 alpha subunit
MLENIQSNLNFFFNSIKKENETYFKDAGLVLSINDGVAKILGLNKIRSGELVNFKNNLKGMALNLELYSVGVIIFGSDREVSQGDYVTRSFSIIQVPVGRSLEGTVVDSLGNFLLETENKNNNKFEFYNVESKAPGIISRKSVHEPLLTGITAIDSMIPVGLGQRELIIGDKQTGKTAIAVDTIINQKVDEKKKSINQINCIYVAVGQKKSTVAQLVNRLKNENALSFTTIVSATASDSASLQFLAPYSGCAMGE